MNTQKEQQFADGIWYKERNMGDWKAQSISINVKKFIEFLQANEKADGYVNLKVKARRNPDPKNTHYIVVDDYVKGEQKEKADSPAKAAFRKSMSQPKQKAFTPPTANETAEQDEVPF